MASINLNFATPRRALIAALLFTAAAYWVGLNGPLVIDDAQNLAPITQWLQGKYGWAWVVFGNQSGIFGRPLSMASFVLNVVLLGPGVWGLKLGNLLLHLLNGYLVYALFDALLRQGALTRTPQTNSRWFPVFGAALWLLHPLLVSTVLYVVQRMAMLSALFTLLAMLAYLHGRVALAADRKRRAWALLLLAVPIFTVLAVLSKENGILAPALCAVLELFVFIPHVDRRRPWPSTMVVILGLVVPGILAIVLTAIHFPAITSDYANRSFTLIERLLTEPRVLWDYVGSLVVPYGPRLGLYHDDYAVSHSLIDPITTLFSLVGWLLTLVAAWRLRRQVPGFGLGVGIFLVGHSLESSVFPLLIYFEHRNYLPSVGAIWALISIGVLCAAYLRRQMDHPDRVFTGAAIAFLLVLGLSTGARARVWRTQTSLLTQAIAYHPESRWLRMDLVILAMHQDPPQFATARYNVDFLRRSKESSTRRLGAVSRIAIDCSDQQSVRPDIVKEAFAGRPDPIEPDLLVTFEALSEGLPLRPCSGLSTIGMANLLSAMLDRSNLPPANVSIWRLRMRAATLYSISGKNDEALKQARLAYANGASDVPVYALIVALQLQRGDTGGASTMLEAAQHKLERSDVVGQELIAQYRTELSRQLRSKTPQ